MVGRSTLLILVLALSGCTDAPEAPATTESVITDPNDYSYLDNQTDGAGWHVHDYWRGQDTLTLLQSEKPAGGLVSYSGDQGAPLATFRAEPGNVVPQGTAALTITSNWGADDNSEYGDVHLQVQTAADNEFRDLGALTPGKAVMINSTNDDNDPPHQTLSLWQFRLRAMPVDGASDTTLSGAHATMKVVVERGLEIPAWPPHPDFWNGADEITLIEESGGDTGLDVGMVLTHSCISTCTLRSFTLPDGVLVPFDATSVRFEVTKQPAQPVSVELTYHGADTWDLRHAEAVQDDLNGLVFEIPVDQAVGDSPYALQSLWQFEMAPERVDDYYIHLLAGDLAVKITAHR